MGFTKIGTDEGKIIDVQKDIAKLGSKIKCTGCGVRFAANTPDDFVRRQCAACQNKD